MSAAGGSEAEPGGAGPAVSERLLISLPNWLGDAVLASGLLGGLARLGRALTVDVCGNPVALAVAGEHPVVRRAIRYERHGAHGRPRAFLRLTAALRAERYTTHVVLPSTPSAAVFARLVSAPVRAGFAGPGRRLCFTRCARRGPRGSAHLLEEYRAVLALLEWSVPAAEPAVPVGAAAAARAGQLSGPAPYAVLVPGAIFGPTKRWPAASFAAAGAALAARHGLRLVLVGAPGDRPATAAVGDALRAGGFPHGAVVDLTGRTDIPTLAAVLAGAVVVLSNDSGPMHLARAVGAPTVGVFGSTEPRWTAPRGGGVVLATERPACAPCYQRRCPIDFVCLTRIAPDQVVVAAEAELRLAADRADHAASGADGAAGGTERRRT